MWEGEKNNNNTEGRDTHTCTHTSLALRSSLGAESCCSITSDLIGRELGEACSDWMVKVEYRPDFM